MSDWDVAIARHLARRPKPPNCPLSMSVAEYNRVHREYDEAMRLYNADTSAAVQQLGLTVQNTLPEGYRTDSDSGGRLLPVRQVYREGDK